MIVISITILEFVIATALGVLIISEMINSSSDVSAASEELSATAEEVSSKMIIILKIMLNQVMNYLKIQEFNMKKMLNL